MKRVFFFAKMYASLAVPLWVPDALLGPTALGILFPGAWHFAKTPFLGSSKKTTEEKDTHTHTHTYTNNCSQDCSGILWGFCLCVFLPHTEWHPPPKQKNLFATHPIQGQSPKSVYVYVSFYLINDAAELRLTGEHPVTPTINHFPTAWGSKWVRRAEKSIKIKGFLQKIWHADPNMAYKPPLLRHMNCFYWVWGWSSICWPHTRKG